MARPWPYRSVIGSTLTGVLGFYQPAPEAWIAVLESSRVVERPYWAIPMEQPDYSGERDVSGLNGWFLRVDPCANPFIAREIGSAVSADWRDGLLHIEIERGG